MFRCFWKIVLVLAVCMVVSMCIGSFYRWNTFFADSKNAISQSADDSRTQDINLRVESNMQQIAAPEPETMEIMVMFTKAQSNKPLQGKFGVCVSSLLTQVTQPMNLHIIGDSASQTIAKLILDKLPVEDSSKVKLVFHDVEPLARGVTDALSEMIDYFRYNKRAYYGDNLFFISMVMHLMFPDLQKVILLDSDLKFKRDVRQLWSVFANFTESQLFGIASEQQPVYRHIFGQYRSQHKGTKIGDPPPDGITGFNSGVLMLDLKKIRASTKYKELLTKVTVEKLVKKYLFKGHLGDQDFYTLLSVEHMDLFFVLPCSWNRQVCSWWKDHGYADVFDQYFSCTEEVKIYHGNCNTPIPD